ncbi:Transcriptional regulator, SARP family [Nostocoides japonicum T1-X7]|uniref:Transcriptional regulator, SARP family n=1 Tax=Nostocoides japonicum T1-X7 TaxID=1194083 RepID=A0A077LX10_9MICO|nr:bacterial transcriptional activator domain-containing protein [Tetrasphaera japonica]CCH78453.1 Transcriptional regulator, SARP family [Tetrasphaera japonica T1-X7]
MSEIHSGSIGPLLRVEVMYQFRVLAAGRVVTLPIACEQVVARLVVEDRPCPRPALARGSWPDRSDRDAGALLRRALWRVNRDVPGLLEGDGRQVGLATGVDIDLAEVQRLSEAVNQGAPPASAHAVRLLQGDLLPQWSEPWLEAPRESLRQVRLHTLESLARNDLDAGRPVGALLASLAAVGIDPLRESAHRIVISAHLAEGNVSEAYRHYAQYRDLLWAEMRLRPSARLEGMLSDGAQVLPLGPRRGVLDA